MGTHTEAPESTIPMATGAVGGVAAGTLTTCSGGAVFGSNVTLLPFTTTVTLAGFGSGSPRVVRAAASLAKSWASACGMTMGADGGGGG